MVFDQHRALSLFLLTKKLTERIYFLSEDTGYLTEEVRLKIKLSEIDQNSENNHEIFIRFIKISKRIGTKSAEFELP